VKNTLIIKEELVYYKKVKKKIKTTQFHNYHLVLESLVQVFTCIWILLSLGALKSRDGGKNSIRGMFQHRVEG
jgi:hypothetical protein